MIMETSENYDSSKIVGEAMTQGLEREEKIKEATLVFIIDIKVSNSVRKLYVQETL